ncbi:MAG: GntR family transcriptional regulator [Synergistaceae bacterium]|nr:GntR family transcriptional regulator [Synergistaceae bacterium]
MIHYSNYYNTSSDFVYHELRTRIVNKQLKPGERLPEVKISNEMGVSRTPVREALRRLASEGLVRIIPNSGARVAAPSAAEIEGAYDVRQYLEALSVQLACRKGIDRRMAERFEEVLKDEESSFIARDIQSSLEANNNFHRLIANASKNIVLIEYVENIILRTNVYILFYDPFTEENNYSSEEHRRILASIMSGDEKSADSLMKEHLRHSHAVLEKPYERRNILAKMNGLAQQNKAFLTGEE